MANEGYGFERYLNVRSAYGASFSPDGSSVSFLTDITGVAEVRLRMDSVKDLQHAALWLRQEGIADARRMAVFGGSYGGFMVRTIRMFLSVRRNRSWLLYVYKAYLPSTCASRTRGMDW